MKPITLETPTVTLPPGRPALADEPLPDGAARPQSGINIGGHTVTKATEHLPEEQRVLVRWLHNHAREMRLGWRELAERVDLSIATLSRIFSDQYRNPKDHERAGERISLDGVCEKIAAFRRAMEKSGRTKNPDFIELTVSTRIWWLCERAGRNCRMAFLYGDGQVGKTTAMREYAAQHNGGATTYAEMPPASGVQYMLKCIAKALYVPPHSSFDDLLDDVIAALDPSKLIILDELDRVFTTYQKKSTVRCLETLRYIYDQAGCGMVLCGNNAFRDQIKEGQFKHELTRFHRRGRSYELQLPTEPPREDLDRMAASFGLDPASGDAEEAMLQIARADGIGVFRLRLCDARDFARKQRQEVAWKHFLRAYQITEAAGSSVR